MSVGVTTRIRSWSARSWTPAAATASWAIASAGPFTEKPVATTLHTRSLPHVGVEVFGFDINDPIDTDTRAELEDLWLEHAILLFQLPKLA